ncbi:hypothetical protein CFP56_001049 [Quercus suber]|uniref:DUF7870 domain-containing protein n=1 Tax=Quercus suber TaxID=58331 RepID=A0AAW0INA3_QUESU
MLGSCKENRDLVFCKLRERKEEPFGRILGFKCEIIRNAEPLIQEEPLKPWLTLKRNINNIKFQTSSVEISFKNRNVYVDVGAWSYSSSIVSWFKKKYPKKNKTFEIYAIEADKTFHEEYR